MAAEELRLLWFSPPAGDSRSGRLVWRWARWATCSLVVFCPRLSSSLHLMEGTRFYRQPAPCSHSRGAEQCYGSAARRDALGSDSTLPAGRVLARPAVHPFFLLAPPFMGMLNRGRRSASLGRRFSFALAHSRATLSIPVYGALWPALPPSPRSLLGCAVCESTFRISRVNTATGITSAKENGRRG